MLRVKGCASLCRRQRGVKRLAIILAFTVTLVVIGDTLYRKIKTNVTPTSNTKVYDSHSAASHLKMYKKFTRTGHELPLPGHKLIIGHGFVKEEHTLTTDDKLTTEDHDISTDTGHRHTSTSTRVSIALKDQLPHSYRYLINEPHLCFTLPNLYIINLVSTAPQDHQNRTLIRRLWGNDIWTRETGFKTVFLLGATKDANVMAAVQEERDTYHDIIQFSFLDSYRNLTVKILSGLHWVNNFCPTPIWVLKSDTDVLINIFTLTRFLHTYDAATNHSRNQFVCRPFRQSVPCRPPCSNPKWVVTWEQYPHQKFPTYCGGPAYMFPRRMVGALYHAANKTNPFHIEDVYYTGILPEQLQWQSAYKSIYEHFSWRPKRWRESFTTTDLMILELDVHLGRGTTIRVWQKILHNQGVWINRKML